MTSYFCAFLRSGDFLSQKTVVKIYVTIGMGVNCFHNNPPQLTCDQGFGVHQKKQLGDLKHWSDLRWLQMESILQQAMELQQVGGPNPLVDIMRSSEKRVVTVLCFDGIFWVYTSLIILIVLYINI